MADKKPISPHWTKRIQQFTDGSIEQRVEQITQTCLEIWMADINHRLKEQFGDVADLLTMDDLMPKPAAAGVERPPRIEPIHGLHGIVFGEVARCMAARKDLALLPSDIRQLHRLTELNNRTVSPQRETGILLHHFPQIGKLEKDAKPEGLGSADALYYTVHRDISCSLADYLNNKHLNNERPSGTGRS